MRSSVRLQEKLWTRTTQPQLTNIKGSKLDRPFTVYVHEDGRMGMKVCDSVLADFNLCGAASISMLPPSGILCCSG